MMYRVKSNLDAKVGYVMLREVEKLVASEGTNNVREELIADLKRELRKWSKRETAEGSIVRDDGIDGFVSVAKMPYDFDSKEEAEEWFTENEYMEVRPSMYDCTGQMFTRWFKVFRRRGSWWVYHSVGVDV